MNTLTDAFYWLHLVVLDYQASIPIAHSSYSPYSTNSISFMFIPFVLWHIKTDPPWLASAVFESNAFWSIKGTAGWP